MKITVVRTDYTAESTSGIMALNGSYFGVTLEDALRDGSKVAGKTAIPPGRYKLELTFSNRFQRVLPLLVNVPGFEGVRIHGGNTAADTEGCILVGSKRVNLDRIMESASLALVSILSQTKEGHEIQIINAWRGE